MQPNHTVFSPIPAGAKKVTYTDTAGTTAALSDDTTAVWVVVTTDAFVRINATAELDKDLYVPAYVPVLLDCPPSATVSAVRVTANGTLYACPVA